MAEYILVLFGLMIVLVGLYSLYSRYIKASPKKERAPNDGGSSGFVDQ